MDALRRFGDWWLGQFRKTGRLGKVAWVGVPLLLSCCFCSFGTALLSPPDVEPEVEVATQELVEATAAATEVMEPTALPVRDPATATRDADGSGAVVSGGRVAAQAAEATEDALTTTPRPTLTLPASATATEEPATAVPPTVTRPPATATSAPLPTAAPTQVPPTAVPPTAVPPTPVPPTAVPPTEVPQPTATLVVTGGVLVIINVDKGAEVVTIRNDGGSPVDLGGWVLRSEKGSQDCGLGGVLDPGQSLAIWAMAENADRGGWNCGFGSNIWNNSDHDPAVLIDPSGAEVSRW